MDCEWLAGLVWEGMGGLGMDCEWLAGLSIHGLYGWEGLGFGVGSNLAVHFDFFIPCRIFPKFWQFAFAFDRICVITSVQSSGKAKLWSRYAKLAFNEIFTVHRNICFPLH